MQELNTSKMRAATRDKLDRLRRLFEAESHGHTHISDWFDSLRARGERFGNAQLSAWLGTNSYYTESEYTRLAVTHAVHPSQIDKPIVPVQESLTVDGHMTNKGIKDMIAAKLAEARDGLVAEAVADVLARIEAARFRLVPGGTP